MIRQQRDGKVRRKAVLLHHALNLRRRNALVCHAFLEHVQQLPDMRLNFRLLLLIREAAAKIQCFEVQITIALELDVRLVHSAHDGRKNIDQYAAHKEAAHLRSVVHRFIQQVEKDLDFRARGGKIVFPQPCGQGVDALMRIRHCRPAGEAFPHSIVQHHRLLRPELAGALGVFIQCRNVQRRGGTIAQRRQIAFFLVHIH